MGKKMSISKELIYSFLIYPAAVLFLISGCATGPSKTGDTRESKTPSIQQANAAAPAKKDKDSAWKSVSDIDIETTVTEQETVQEDKVIADAAVEEVKDITPSEPRIFFEPGKSDINQVLGIDFTLAENGKSRLTVTTSRKTDYDLDRKDEKTLVLRLYDSTIASPLLMRHIDTTEFQSAIEGIKQSYSSQNKEVDLTLSMREIVPFNLIRTDSGITIDFGQTSIKVEEKKIVPLDLAETQTRALSVADTQAPAAVASAGVAATGIGTERKRYSGQKVSLTFSDADVTHILTIINDISGENVIWDPSITGRKVSMILNNVPWDEVLDLVLDNNDLAMRYRGENIIWVTTKDKMNKILAEEEAERQRLIQLAEEEENRRREKEKAAKEEEPLITEYLPVDFAKADDIQAHIKISDRGAMTVDIRTNTIIITDIAENIETAKKTIKQFDTPVKQVMIEARIVEATDTFSRDLGIKWNSDTSIWSNNEGNLTTDDVPQNALNFTANGEKGVGGSFSTNAPTEEWEDNSNIGLSFGRLSSNGLSAITLDASLAIAESEGTAKTLSAPKVIATEGETASISRGDSIIIPATENVASTTLDATLSLEVTPISISYNDYINLEVSVTDDSAPSTSRLLKKAIETTLMVPSGETVVIGGIINESDGDNVSGVPVLKDIPILGWLFKAKSANTSRSELLIFLTPTVLPSPVK